MADNPIMSLPVALRAKVSQYVQEQVETARSTATAQVEAAKIEVKAAEARAFTVQQDLTMCQVQRDNIAQDLEDEVKHSRDQREYIDYLRGVLDGLMDEFDFVDYKSFPEFLDGLKRGRKPRPKYMLPGDVMVRYDEHDNDLDAEFQYELEQRRREDERRLKAQMLQRISKTPRV